MSLFSTVLCGVICWCAFAAALGARGMDDWNILWITWHAPDISVQHVNIEVV